MIIDFEIGSLVVLISGRNNVYRVTKIDESTDDVEITRYVDGEPRWMNVKCWEVRLATKDECKNGCRSKI